MRFEQIEIDVVEGAIMFSQQDIGFGEMRIYIPIEQWEYVSKEIEKLLKA